MTDKLHGKNLRIWIFALLGGIVFAAFDRCGYMIQHYGTLWAISENPLHKTIFHRILIRVPLFTAGVLISFLLLNWLRGRNADSGAGLPKRESQGSTAPQTAVAKMCIRDRFWRCYDPGADDRSNHSAGWSCNLYAGKYFRSCIYQNRKSNHAVFRGITYRTDLYRAVPTAVSAPVSYTHLFMETTENL